MHQGFHPFARFANFMDDDDFDMMPPGQHQQAPEEIENKELYEILELPPQSDISEIKGAYRRMAKKYHPDKPGGDQDKFQLVQRAYEVLSDPKLKEIYDTMGKDALVRNVRQKKQNYKKCEPIEMPFKIKLEDVMLGAYKKTSIKIQKICTACEGKGGAQSSVCQTCQGHRLVQIPVEMGPGMFILQTAPCRDCQGRGIRISEEDQCKGCKGNCTLQVETEIEIPIEKGVPDNYLVKLYGKGNEEKDHAAGDVVIQLQIENHPNFTRKGADLFYQKTISLKEALIGVSFELEMLDKSTISISNQDNKIIKPNEILTVPDKGLPMFHNELHNGDLHVQFIIEFPNELNNQQKQAISILPGPQVVKGKPDSNKLIEFNFEKFEQHQEIPDERKEHEEDEEPGMNCGIF